jgi:hypothetical protein
MKTIGEPPYTTPTWRHHEGLAAAALIGTHTHTGPAFEVPGLALRRDVGLLPDARSN